MLMKEASLLSTVADMELLSRKMFFNSLNCHASKLVEKVSTADRNFFAEIESSVNLGY